MYYIGRISYLNKVIAINKCIRTDALYTAVHIYFRQ